VTGRPNSAQYYVYIMASERQTLYVGVTNDVLRWVDQHKASLVPGFTSKYGITKLVYYEATEDVWAALEREKQIKGWVRRRKVALIRSVNPGFDDLSTEWSASPRLPNTR
jgi:putative endonuclease